GAASELAPVTVHGQSPGHLLAAMSVATIGNFTLEAFTWAADDKVVAQRTDRPIRASDPESYRIFLSVTPGLRVEQADHRVDFGVRDIALYDMSQPNKTILPAGPTQIPVIGLTFPRALVPLDRTTVQPLVGTLMPRSLPGRSLVAQFLIGLTEPGATDDPGL